MGPRIPYDTTVVIPDSFPRGGAQGAVPGAQPKFLARLIEGRYVCGATDDEVRIRYLICADYVTRMSAHLRQKLLEVSIPMDAFVECLRWDFQLKGFSLDEGAWMTTQIVEQVGLVTKRVDG